MNATTPSAYHLSSDDVYTVCRDLHKAGAALRLLVSFLEGAGDLMTGAAEVIDLTERRLIDVIEEIDIPPGTDGHAVSEHEGFGWLVELEKLERALRFMGDRIDYETPGRALDGLAEVLGLAADKIKASSEFLEQRAKTFTEVGSITIRGDRATAEAVDNVRATLERILSDLPAMTPARSIQLLRAEFRNILNHLDDVITDSRHI